MKRILDNDVAFSVLRMVCAMAFTVAVVIILLRPDLQTIVGIPLLKIAAQYHVSLLGHVLTFALMFFFWCWALIPHFRSSSAPMLAFLIVITLGTAGEFGQTFVPGRYASAADMLANCAGVAFAWWSWQVLTIMSNRRYAVLLRYP